MKAVILAGGLGKRLREKEAHLDDIYYCPHHATEGVRNTTRTVGVASPIRGWRMYVDSRTRP